MVKRYPRTFFCPAFILLVLFVFTAPATASAEIVDRIVAIVNDDIITLSELNRAVRPYEDKLDDSGYSQEKKKALMYKLRQDMLTRLVDQKITDQEVKKLGMTVSDEEVDQAIERLKGSRMMTQEDLEAALEKEGLTYNAYREKLREEILRPRLINHSVKSKVIITDEDIKAYYDAHPELYAGERKIYLRNILIAEGIPGADVLLQEKKDEVTGALGAGAPFAQVAARYSQAPNGPDGGDLGLFSLSTLSPEIRQAVKGLAAGAHSAFIKTDSGYQMFYVESVEAASQIPLETVSSEISRKLYSEIAEQKFNTWIESLREKSHVKRML